MLRLFRIASSAGYVEHEGLHLVCACTDVQVAQQCSEDKARQGGDLGWKTRQEVVGAFAEAAFKLNVRLA